MKLTLCLELDNGTEKKEKLGKKFFLVIGEREKKIAKHEVQKVGLNDERRRRRVVVPGGWFTGGVWAPPCSAFGIEGRAGWRQRQRQNPQRGSGWRRSRRRLNFRVNIQ